MKYIVSGIMCLVLAVASHAAQQSSVTMRDITWTFDKDYEVGQYCTGDWWVKGPVVITAITNSWHTYGYTPTDGQDGSMINPGGTGQQGYDNTLGSYSEDLNASLIGGQKVSATNPLTLPTDQSLISSVSWLYASEDSTEPGCPGFNGGTNTPRPVLRNAEILTCVTEEPSAGSFRPPYCGSDKAEKYTKDQIKYDLLRNFDPPSSVPDLAGLETGLERPWIDHVYQYAGAFLHPSENMPQYGRDMSIFMGKAAMMLHLDFSQMTDSPSKEKLAIGLIQMGIDFTAIADTGGGWPANGGHHMGRKWPILFAGLMLDDAHMQGLGTWDTEFQEDDQTFVVDQAAVDMTHSTAWAPDSRATPLPYETENIGLPEWGINHSFRTSADNMHWGTTYRTINNMSYPGFLLAAHVMNAREAWNHDVLFDYIDRSTLFGSQGYAPGEKNHEYYTYGSTFIYELWQAHRFDFGCTWVPDDTADVYSVGGTDCSRCVYNCPGDTNAVRVSHMTDAATMVTVWPNPVCGDGAVNFMIPRGSETSRRDVSTHYKIEIRTAAGDPVFIERINDGLLKWDGCDNSGRRVEPGIYFYTVIADEGTYSGRIIRSR